MSEKLEIYPADPNMRKSRAYVLALVLLGVCVFSYFLISGFLGNIVDLLESGQANRGFDKIDSLWTGMIILLAGGSVIMSLYSLWIGYKILHSGQHPFPGMKVWSDRKISRGAAAKRKAFIYFFLSVVLIAFGLIGSCALVNMQELMLLDSRINYEKSERILEGHDDSEFIVAK